MPKVVDHDRRRDELADAALRLIARHGRSAVTTRAVAEEAGWSTGVLSHYFATIGEVLVAALRRAAELQGRALRESRSRTDRDALGRLQLILESVLPLDERRVALTRIFLVFYADASPATREEIVDYLDTWRRFVVRTLAAGEQDGSIQTGGQDHARLAIDLVALTDGLAMHAVIDPKVLESLQEEQDPGLRVIRDVLDKTTTPQE